jgi:hypothetical protein
MHILIVGGESMIIVNTDNTPVACYDDISPKEALRAYADENLPGSGTVFIFIDTDGAALMQWQGKKYTAFIYLEDF